MLRRILPTLAVLALGLTLLLWGLGSLQRIIFAQHEEARAQVKAERNALQEYARRTLEQRLESLLHETEIEWALGDPLMATQHLLLVDRGEQIFPRAIRYAAANAHGPRRLYVALRDGAPVQASTGTPWARRVELVRSFREALLEGLPEAIETSFREIAEHRAHWVLDARQDLPAQLAVLDLLVEYAAPHPELVGGLLRDGLYAGDHLILEGLQAALIRGRDRFSAADFQFLCGRVIALSERTQTRVDDFQARVAEPVTVPLSAPGMLDAPSLILGGSWYARPAGPDRIIGVAIGIDELLRSVESEMRARALLEPDDALVRPDVAPEVVPLPTLVLDVRSSRFGKALEDADRRFWLMTGFVGLSAFLALIIVALALFIQLRRQRFVELKSDFVATVSHELRTPLASIRLMAETLERRTAGLPAVRDYPTRIVRDIDDLAFLVENILSFNRLDKGRWKPRPSTVALDELAGLIEQELPMFAPRAVEWHTEGLQGVSLYVDHELVKLLLRNLAKNACAYNERDPIRIVLVGRQEGHRFSLTVGDNGVGIPATEQKRIFSDFYRAKGTVSRGSGLGLAICRKIMAAHGGRIVVTTSSPEGTTFELTFPI